jgi:hypothetical protein
MGKAIEREKVIGDDGNNVNLSVMQIDLLLG